MAHYDGDITRVNIHPRMRDKVLAKYGATGPPMTAYRCPVCDYVYDETKGAPREGFPAGTPFSEIPDDWTLPRLRGAREGRLRISGGKSHE